MIARVNWRKIGFFLLSLCVFILAIQLLKEGARGLAPFIRDRLRVDNIANGLGFGWLFAYLVLSGSPVAATALAFFDAGAIGTLETFAMIAGSRLGASFIVLFLGFLHVLRGHRRPDTLAMGLLSLWVTWAVYVPALAVGYFLLRSGALAWAQMRSGPGLNSLVDVVFDPIANFVTSLLPRPLIFVLGFGVVLGAFAMFDLALPDLHLRESAFGGMARLLYRPLVTFALGAAITTISMSVSLSLGILVPLSARGYIRRENVIPYIMGANITTFVDTLFAAVLLNNPTAFTVVLVEMVSVALVSLAILLFAYRPFERGLLRLVASIAAGRRRLAVFVFAIIGLPILLMLIR